MSRATFYFTAEDGGDPIVFETEGTMKKLLGYLKQLLPVAKLLYQNRKAEAAILVALADVFSRVLGH